MEILNVLWTALAAIAHPPFGPWLGGALAITVVLFFVTAAARSAIDRALSAQRGGGKPLGFLDLSRGDAAAAKRQKVLVAPERLWSYDENYIEDFVKAAGDVNAWRQPALQLYVRFVLRWDMAFAFSLATFIVLFWWSVATAPWAPVWLGRFALFAECMGIFYGCVDIGEDIKLIFILLDSGKIDPAESAAANALTRIKFVATALSIVGMLLFGVLSAGYRAFTGLLRPCIDASETLYRILFRRPTGQTGSSGGVATT